MPTGLIGERVVPKPNTFPEWIVERLTAHPAGALLFRPEMRMRGEARVVVPPTGQRGFWRDDLYALLDARAEVDGDRRKWNVVALQGPLEGVVIIWLEWKASDGEGRTPLAEGAYKRCKPPLSRMRFIKGPVLLMRKADWDETR